MAIPTLPDIIVDEFLSIESSPFSSTTSLVQDTSASLKSSLTSSFTDSEYVLPPIPIDVTPISKSLESILEVSQLRYEECEARAPPSIALPPAISYALPSNFKEEQIDTLSPLDALSEVLSVTALPPTPSRSADSLPLPPLPPSPPPQYHTVRGVRCKPPRSNAHPAFPSPPPTPDAVEVDAPPPVRPTVHFDLPPSVRPRAPGQGAGRRYVSPAYVRGQMLPFSIAEETEDSDPSTSDSEYSLASAARSSESDLYGENYSAVSSGEEQPWRSPIPQFDEAPWRAPLPSQKLRRKASLRRCVQGVKSVGAVMARRSSMMF